MLPKAALVRRLSSLFTSTNSRALAFGGAMPVPGSPCAWVPGPPRIFRLLGSPHRPFAPRGGPPRAHLSLVMWLWPTCVGTGSLNQNKNRIYILRNHLIFIPLSKATVDGRGIGLWIIERHSHQDIGALFFADVNTFFTFAKQREKWSSNSANAYRAYCFDTKIICSCFSIG